MHYLFLILFFVLSLHAKEKKILIFSCTSGGGHEAAASALDDFLGDNYEIETHRPNDEIYPFFRDFYTYHLANFNYNIINFGHIMREHWFPIVSLLEDPKYFFAINEYIEKTKPDLLVSVVPFANHLCVDAANKYKIPFLIVSCDNDISAWVNGLKERDLSRVQMTISRDLPVTKTFLLKNNFSLNQIQVTGLAVRSDFFEPKDKKEICSKFRLPLDKQKIMIMFGGAGSKKTLEYVKKINQSLSHIHIIASCGKSEEVSKELQKIVLKNGNTMTILGFTKQISDYMAVSDLFITKAGPGTIEEAFLLKLPILVDGTQGFIMWEKLNADLVTAYQVGSIVKEMDTLPVLITHYLNNIETIQKAYQKMEKNEFPKKIKEIVDSLIQTNGT